MGLFQEWLRARMYRKQITKGIKEVLEQPQEVDTSQVMPTGQKVLTFREIIKANAKDKEDVYEILYDILKDDAQSIDRSSIKKSKPNKIIIHLDKKFSRGKMEFTYELKPLKNKLILSLKAEISGWGRSWYSFQEEELKRSLKETVEHINQILE